MWLNIARVSQPAFSRIQKEPSLLDALFFDDDEAAKKTLAELGIDQTHISGVDYRSAYETLVAMAEITGEELDEEADPVLDDLGVSGEIDYDAGYGPAFYVDQAGTAQAKESIVWEMDDEVAALIQAAAEAGEHLVGVIS